MNLIEQIGGYENVSKHFNRIEYHAETKIFIGEWFGFYSMRDLKDALLEHRRANNIFQEGDAIVRRWNNRVYWIITDIDNGSESMINENKNAKFKDCKVCDMPCNFTFATDAEIQAGHRL